MISGSLITIPVLFFGGVILALRKDVTMSLILLLFVPAIFLIVRPISKRIGPLHETSDKYIDIQNDVMRERLHGIRVIRAFNKEVSLQQKIADATHVMAENIINANVQMGLLSPAAVLLVNLAGVAILWLGGWRMETGSHAISGGDIFAIIQYLALVANGVLMGGFAIVMLPHARVAAGRIGEIFQATGMQETAKGAEHTFGGEIAFDHVTFRYEGASEAAVQDVSMHILPGQKIAIVGPTGAGKSTMARACAKALGYLYVDTGAIYRTVGYYMRLMGIGPKDQDGIRRLIDEVNIDIRYADGVQHMILNGEDVTSELRTPEMSMYASGVSAQPCVRAFLLDMQRQLARTHNVIMDGRDIGTTILPNAQVKIFLTASPEVRAERRYKELKEKGVDVSYEETLANVIRRDKQDEKQSKAAEDSILLDNSELDFDGTVNRLLEIVEERTGVKHG